jgi:hypothetical protein
MKTLASMSIRMAPAELTPEASRHERQEST